MTVWQPVARGARPGLFDDATGPDRILDRGDHEPLSEFRDPAVAELDRLGEVVACVHVHHREWERRRAERLLRQAQQHDRVLAPAEQQDGPLEFGGDLAHDVDGLGLQGAQMGQVVGGWHPCWKPAFRQSGGWGL